MLDAAEISSAAAVASGPASSRGRRQALLPVGFAGIARRDSPRPLRASKRERARALPAGALLRVHSAHRGPVAPTAAARSAGAHRASQRFATDYREPLDTASRTHAAHQSRDQSRRHVGQGESAHPVTEGNDRGAVARDAHAIGTHPLRRRGTRGRSRGKRTRTAACLEQRRPADRRSHLRHARLCAARPSGVAHELPDDSTGALAAAGAGVLSAARQDGAGPFCKTISTRCGWSRVSWSWPCATWSRMRCDMHDTP